MPKQLIYQSPKRDNPKNAPHRSAWIDESDESARRRLEAMGWRLVETRDAPAPALAPALQPVPDTDAQAFASASVRVANADRFDFLTDEQRAALSEAGYGTDELLRAASDDDLRGVTGIGPATVRNLRKALLQPSAEGDGSESE